MPARARNTLIVALALVGGACRLQPAEALDVAGDASSPATHYVLNVDNHNWSDVVVFMEHDGTRSRVGTAKAATFARMRVPAAWIVASRGVRLIAHRIGSATEFKSDPFVVQSEQVIEWTLESDLQRSSVAVR